MGRKEVQVFCRYVWPPFNISTILMPSSYSGELILVLPWMVKHLQNHCVNEHIINDSGHPQWLQWPSAAPAFLNNNLLPQYWRQYTSLASMLLFIFWYFIFYFFSTPTLLNQPNDDDSPVWPDESMMTTHLNLPQWWHAPTLSDLATISMHVFL